MPRNASTPSATSALPIAADGRAVPSGTLGEIYMRIGFCPDFTYLGRDDLRREVQPLDGHSISPAGVQAFLAARLATYKVPRSIALRAELPREDSGKIFKRCLRDPYWESAGRLV